MKTSTDRKKHTEDPGINHRIDHIFQLQKENIFTLRQTRADLRIAKLEKVMAWIYENQAKIRQAVYADFKKPAPEVDITEIYITLQEIKHAIKHLHNWMKPKRIRRTLTTITTRSHIRYESKGVVLIISPWNFPFMLAMGPFVSALAAGNCIILKPSELSPNTSRLLGEMIQQLFPENEAAVFEGDKTVASELLKKPFDHIFFTGSTDVGKIVMRAASENLTSVTLELGGMNAVILDETWDIRDAVQKIIAGKFVNAGQMCICPNHIFVHKNQYGKFLNILKRQIERTYGRSKDERQENEDFSRIINRNHFNRLRDLIDDAVQKSAKIEIGGEVNEKENYISPSILTNVNQNSRIIREEIFGPLLPVIPYNSLDEVIKTLNDQPTPLTLYIFSKSRDNVEKILSQTSSGNCCINEIGQQFFHPNFPFGGRNQSGMGNAHGFYGFKAFSYERPVLKQTRFSPLKLIYPPFTKFSRRLIDLIIKYL